MGLYQMSHLLITRGGGGELISERLRYSLQIPDTRKIREEIHFTFLHLRINGLDSSRLLASLVYHAELARNT